MSKEPNLASNLGNVTIIPSIVSDLGSDIGNTENQNKELDLTASLKFRPKISILPSTSETTIAAPLNPPFKPTLNLGINKNPISFPVISVKIPTNRARPFKPIDHISKTNLNLTHRNNINNIETSSIDQYEQNYKLHFNSDFDDIPGKIIPYILDEGYKRHKKYPYKYLDMLGRGAYGEVFLAEDQSGNKFAIKRNLIDKTTTFKGAVKELDMLARLRGHPFIISLNSISFTDPFDHRNMPRIEDDYKMDSMFFIYETARYDVHTLIYPKGDGCTAISFIKMSMIHLLLGVEYLHSQNIIHRDLKPSNLLWVKSGEYSRRLKICDFGLSITDTGQEPRTPRTMTSWYRAPEVAGRSPNYTVQADIWSVGCILFEMVSKRALFYKIADDDEIIYNKILATIPEVLDRHDIINTDWRDPDKKIAELEQINRNKVSFEKCPEAWRKIINLEEHLVKEFNSPYSNGLVNSGDYDQFLDLLSKIMRFNPSKRLTATQILDHPFFEGHRKYISEIREKFPLKYGLNNEVELNGKINKDNIGLNLYSNLSHNINENMEKITIIECLERKWAAETIFTLYNERGSRAWYKHRILFQALDLFDRYLVHCYNTNRFNRNRRITKYGEELTRTTGQIYFMVCLYLSIKYFSSLSYSYESLVHQDFRSEGPLKTAANFEIEMLTEVLNFKIYRNTVYEEADRHNIYLDQTIIGNNGEQTSFTRYLLEAYGRSRSVENVPLTQLFFTYLPNIKIGTEPAIKKMPYCANDTNNISNTNNDICKIKGKDEEITYNDNKANEESVKNTTSTVSPSMITHQQGPQLVSIKKQQIIINSSKSIGDLTGRNDGNETLKLNINVDGRKINPNLALPNF